MAAPSLLADRVMVFGSEPAATVVLAKQSMRDGMNEFLVNLEVTFRCDECTLRPRINKPESQLDRQQKSDGEYYYVP